MTDRKFRDDIPESVLTTDLSILIHPSRIRFWRDEYKASLGRLLKQPARPYVEKLIRDVEEHIALTEAVLWCLSNYDAIEEVKAIRRKKARIR